VVDRALTVEHWGDAVTMGRLAGDNAAADASDRPDDARRWSDPPGFWSEIGDHTLKYSAWGDGYEELRVVEHGPGAFTVWYADAGGELVGVLTHDRDEDYERGGELLARRASLSEALDPSAGPS
jgi:NADPH-dependent 2,4-dienoyl-CoA reductase/sulfur reductase-like enzyme